MINLPEITEGGFRVAEPTINAVSIKDMAHQIETYQPQYWLFLKEFWKSSKATKKQKRTQVTLIWHALSTLSGEFMLRNQRYFDAFTQTLTDSVGTVPPETKETNDMMDRNLADFDSGKMLIDIIGKDAALPILEMCGNSLDPTKVMISVLYVINYMSNRARYRVSTLHPN